MTSEAPFPITVELLHAHPTYVRAQAILSGWHRTLLQKGPPQEKRWRQHQVETLDMVIGTSEPKNSDWFWSMERELTAHQLLFDFIRCAFHEEPEERMEGWKSLQKAVARWDEKFADDTDVA